MFDDPKKELKRLQEQLLAAEEEQWEEEIFEEPEQIPEEAQHFLLEEPEPVEEELEEEPEEEPVARSHVPALVAALLVEVAALLGVLAWWLLWR